MRFSKTADYALRIMVALANAGDARLSLQTISKQEKVPRKFLEHVMRDLKEAQLIDSASGPKGGYTLAAPAANISVAQILNAVQGQWLTDNGFDINDVPEHLQEPVEKLHRVIRDIRLFAQQRLEDLSLGEIAEIKEVDSAHTALMYYI